MLTRRQFLRSQIALGAGLAGWATGAIRSHGAAAESSERFRSAIAGFDFIDTGFENASPLWYETGPDGLIAIQLLYDHERSSPNRAAGHIHFRIHGRAGTRLRLEFRNLDNIWNGRPGSIAGELKTLVVSTNGRDWASAPTEALPGNRVQLAVELPDGPLFVARVEPYRISDLERLLREIGHHRHVRVEDIGETVEGRRLEIVRIGRESARHRVFLRARAHPWEAGTNWVVEGLIRRLLRPDAEARRWLDAYCLHVLPMANKDGVARGRTRFNLLGKDLNRDWDHPVDARLAPENLALERWLAGRIRVGRAPHLALEMHNDGQGQLHRADPGTAPAGYGERMTTLERLLREHTWFTEGHVPGTTGTASTLADGWSARFGIDALVHELNCQWIEGLHQAPLARHWLEYGARLGRVLFEYFEAGGGAR